MKDWEEVCAFCLAMPGVTMESHYRALVPKVNGKAIVAPGRETGSFALMTGHDEKALLMATEPHAYWQTPHYDGYPAVLVRYGAGDQERLKDYIRRSWWDRASRALRRDFGERP